MNRVITILLLLLVCMTSDLFAQKEGRLVDNLRVKHTVDSNYIQQFHSPLELTTRLFNSIKYSRFHIRDRALKQKLLYRSNENLILGLGVSYRKLTFNLGLNFPFINNDEEEKGETKYLDAQVHYYLNRYIVDLWFSYFKGYYLSNPHEATSQPITDTSYPIRPDIRNIVISASIMRVLNPTKFSLRAAFVQDEWQKKSAGSFLAGAEYNMIVTKGDSSLLPRNIQDPDFFSGYRLNQYAIFSLGVNGGYGYTWVLFKHLFVNFVAVGSVGLSYVDMDSKFNSPSSQSDVAININYSGRFSMGYNSRSVFVGISNVYTFTSNDSPIGKGSIIQNSGNVRLNVVKRFNLKKPLDTPLLRKIW
jgi:hypothetical protein